MTKLSQTHLSYLYPNLIRALETGDCADMFEEALQAQVGGPSKIQGERR